MPTATKTARRRDPYRVLFMNLGYATGLDGSFKSYLTQWYRYLYTPRKIIRQIRQSIYALLNKENPDLCCIVEVHHKHGFVPHPRTYRSQVENKYGRRSPLRFLPFFRDNCNGFYSHKPLHFQKRYFKRGSKKLVYEIELENGLVVILAHFSLGRFARRRQFRELETIINGRKNVIVCGDFNIFRGLGELTALADDCGLRVVNANGATFPSANPSKTFDLFLCPKDLRHASARVMTDIQVSDHLPVLLEIG